MSNQPRFNQEATTHSEARQYYVNRAISLLAADMKLTYMGDRTWGVTALFENVKNGVRAESAYVFPQHQGKGHYTAWLKEHTDFIISVPECESVWKYLGKHCIKRLLTPEHPLFRNKAYDRITEFYRGRYAKRSGLHCMNHIDEGIFILQEYYGDMTERTLSAWCLHPLVQKDEDLRRVLDSGPYDGVSSHELFEVSRPALLLAMEYRHTANSYLSPHGPRAAQDIKLSPIGEVNQMLVADKIQNRKDFENYLMDKVPNARELDSYFRAWLEALGVTEKEYQDLAGMIQLRTGRQHRPLELPPGTKNSRQGAHHTQRDG